MPEIWRAGVAAQASLSRSASAESFYWCEESFGWRGLFIVFSWARLFCLTEPDGPGLLALQTAVLQIPAVIDRLGNVDCKADVANAHALSDQLISGFEPAEDRLSG